MKLGLCVNPNWIPDRTELAELRPAFLRSLLYRLADLDALKATGLPLLLTVNNEMAEVGGWATWDQAIKAIAERADDQVIGVCVGNEFDLWWQDDPTDVPPELAADLVRRAAAILRPRGIQTIATSVAGRDWQSYLGRMAERCRSAADAFDLHPYGQRPDGWGAPGWMHGDLRVALSRAREIAQKPVICSEYGVKVGDAKGEAEVSAFLAAGAETVRRLGNDTCPLLAWFAWKDQVGAPSERGDAAFGLVAEDGRRRPAWQMFRAQASPVVPIPPDPIPEPVGERPMTVDELQRIRWQAIVTAEYHPDWGFEKAWREHPEWGSPLTVQETTLDDGRPARAFANACVAWSPENGAEVLE